MVMDAQPALVALDWGSSRLRAWLMAGPDAVIDERSSAAGASTLNGAAAFENALDALVGDWARAHPRLPWLACGMVGSAHGWREAPYLHCPVALGALHRQTVTVAWGGAHALRIVPGVADTAPGRAPDVMRGEETQLLGLLALQPALAAGCRVLMPGTHSKWVQIDAGRIVALRTRMTGEVFALLKQHSVLGRLMQPSDGFAADAFDHGVRSGLDSGGNDLLHQLFSVRTRALFGQWPPAALADLLSGLLIGSELAAGLAEAPQLPLALVGEPPLCQRYRRALLAAGQAVAASHDNTAAAGLWHLLAPELH
jgi:2-dehydro-3-deoxygalactonokinase